MNFRCHIYAFRDHITVGQVFVRNLVSLLNLFQALHVVIFSVTLGYVSDLGTVLVFLDQI